MCARRACSESVLGPELDQCLSMSCRPDNVGRPQNIRLSGASTAEEDEHVMFEMHHCTCMFMDECHSKDCNLRKSETIMMEGQEIEVELSFQRCFCERFERPQTRTVLNHRHSPNPFALSESEEFQTAL